VRERPRQAELRAIARLLAVWIPCRRFRRSAEAGDSTLSMERRAQDALRRVRQMGARARELPGREDCSRSNEGEM
jgi:hypothetical protein